MKSQRQIVTHEDVQRALAAFRRSGGTITRLPDQLTPVQPPVSVRWDSWTPDLTVFAGDEGSAEAAAVTVQKAGEPQAA